MKKRLSYKILFISILIGLVTGLVVSLFRLLIPKFMDLVGFLLEISDQSLLYKAIFIGVFLLIGLIVAFCVKKEPMISGSGIPQISGKLSNKLSYNPLTCLLYKIIGGVLSIGS